LHVYSKQDLIVKNEKGQTNMWHMDGNFPSGFRVSDYSHETDRFKPEFVPNTLQEAWIASRSFSEFLKLVWENPITLILWLGM